MGGVSRVGEGFGRKDRRPVGNTSCSGDHFVIFGIVVLAGGYTIERRGHLSVSGVYGLSAQRR
jgi:hypothetical protein